MNYHREWRLKRGQFPLGRHCLPRFAPPDGPRPAVICVETSVYGTTGLVPEIFSLLAERGYAARGGSMINTVFVDVERMQAKAPEGAAVKL